MNKTVRAGARSGSVTIPASKSAAHRQLICAALSKAMSTVVCDGISKDIEATMNCLQALGMKFRSTEEGIRVIPYGFEKAERERSERKLLPCGESGSTLRFLLPVAAALAENVMFHMEGKLPERPHKELIEQLVKHGAEIRQEGPEMYCSGQLKGGFYELPGDISSQFVSGLLFALPLVSEDSTLRITGKIESAAYITMTENAVTEAGIRFEKNGQEYRIPGGQTYRSREFTEVERDWSNAAFSLCAGAFSEHGILTKKLDFNSPQGDKEVVSVLKAFGADVSECGDGILVRKGSLHGFVIDASGIPDLVPVLSVLAAGASGETRIIHAERLRFKESDRLKSTAAMLTALGGTVTETDDGLIIQGTGSLTGGTVNPENDHRIAMAAAVAAGICTGDVTIEDAQCVAKSFPAFFEVWETLEVS